MLKFVGSVLLSLVSVAAFAFGNQDVATLLAAGMSEDIVLAAIQNAAPATFDTSAAGLIALKNAGASPAVIQKVIARQGAGVNVVKPADGACRLESTGMAFKVPIQVGNEIIGLEARKFEYNNKIDGRSVLTALTAGIMATSGRTLLTLSDDKSPIRISERQPQFIDLLLLPNQAPESQFALVRLTSGDGARAVQIATASVGITGGKQAMDFGDAQVPVVLEKVEELCTWQTMRLAHYRMKPTAPLASGEYGFILGKKVYDFGVN